MGNSKQDDGLPFINMLEIGDRVLMAFHLSSFRRVDGFVDGEPKYSILLNEGPLPGNKNFYEDTLISFDTEKERDEEWIELKRKITEDSRIRILD